MRTRAVLGRIDLVGDCRATVLRQRCARGRVEPDRRARSRGRAAPCSNSILSPSASDQGRSPAFASHSVCEGAGVRRRIRCVGISSYDVLTPAGIDEPCLTSLPAAGNRLRPVAPKRHVGDRLRPNPERHRPAARDARAALPLTVIADREDVIYEIAEGSATVHRLSRRRQIRRPPSLRWRETSRRRPHPHGVAPDYGEMPAVTVPKAGTEIAP